MDCFETKIETHLNSNAYWEDSKPRVVKKQRPSLSNSVREQKRNVLSNTFLGGTWEPVDIEKSTRQQLGQMQITSGVHPASFPKNSIEAARYGDRQLSPTLVPSIGNNTDHNDSPTIQVKAEQLGQQSPENSSTQNLELDVLLGRGRKYLNAGNKRLWSYIESHMDEYEKANNRKEIKELKEAAFHSIKETGGRFMEFDNKANEWVEVCTSHAIEKIGQAFRNRKRKGRRTRG